MGNEDTTKRLDSSQEALDHMEHNSLAADEVISDLIRDIWGKDPNAEPPEAESSSETQADSPPESDEAPSEAPQEPESPEEPEESEEPADPADSEKAEEPESSAAPEAPEQPQALTSGAISAAMAAQPDPDTSEDRSDSWYHYGEDDQELEEEAEPLPEPPQKLRKKKRRKRRRHPVLSAVSHGVLVFLTVFSLAYLVAVYSDIPLVTRVRTMYIQSAMNTLNHKWMATAIIPGSIIDSVMRTQYEAAEAAMGVESNWGAVEVQELPVLDEGVDADLLRHDIRFGKGSADMFGCEQIGILTKQIKSSVSVIPINAHGQDRAETKGADKLHQAAHAGLPAEILGDLPRTVLTDAADARQLFRLVFNDRKRLFPELIDDQRSHGGSNAFDRTAREIGIDILLRIGHQSLGKLSLELAAVHVVRRPASADDHGFADGGIGKAADNGDRFPAAVQKAQDGIAVFFVFINDRTDGA